MLDHFITYYVGKSFVGKSAIVNDQIIKKHNKKDLIVTPEFLYQFAIPVSKKIGEEEFKKKNEYAHFNWYSIKISSSFPYTIIFYRNQFTGEEPSRLLIHEPVGLLLPTEKCEKGSKFPEDLDHYLVYAINYRESLKLLQQFKKLELEGQYTKVSSKINPHADYFCVPCSKDGKKIVDENTHFVIYRLQEPDFLNKGIKVLDQWNKGDGKEINILWQTYLMVPSEKTDILPGGNYGQIP